jgi:hypothetical protein
MNDHGLPKALLNTVANLLRSDNDKELEQVRLESAKAAEYHATRGAARPRTAEETKLAVEAIRAPLQRVNDAATKVFAASVQEDQLTASTNKQQLDKAYGKLGAAKPVSEGKAHTLPKTDKEKKLAAIAEPKDKITHADIVTGRKASNLTKEEADFIDALNKDLLETEEVNELSRGTLASYTNKAASKVRTSTALHKDFERNADNHLVKAHKAEKQGDMETADKERFSDKINTDISQDFKKDYRKRLDGIAQATKRLAKEEVNTDTPGNSTHQCAIHVKHSTFGEGKTLTSQHAEPDEAGFISWYDVMFEQGIKRIETKDVEILVSESHMNHPKKKKK